jgi:hypothetical protein
MSTREPRHLIRRTREKLGNDFHLLRISGDESVEAWRMIEETDAYGPLFEEAGLTS